MTPGGMGQPSQTTFKAPGKLFTRLLIGGGTPPAFSFEKVANAVTCLVFILSFLLSFVTPLLVCGLFVVTPSSYSYIVVVSFGLFHLPRYAWFVTFHRNLFVSI